jgi:hypothetical protein
MISYENRKLEKILLSFERKKNFKNFSNNDLLKIAFKLVNFSLKTKDWRYLNLALKIRDKIKFNSKLNSLMRFVINKI